MRKKQEVSSCLHYRLWQKGQRLLSLYAL
jgi:hypothetical protein